MNKKAQVSFDDPMQLIGVIISGFIGIILIGFLVSFLSGLGCEDEIRDLSNCQTNYGICQSQLQNQSILEQSLNDQCNQRINQTTENLTTNLNEYKIIVNEYRQTFLLYHISIVLSLVFGISLFKFVFKWKIHTQNKKLKILLKSIKVCWIGIWIILGVLFVGLLFYSLFYLLFPHWFI